MAIVFTNGCFDIITPAHISVLQCASMCGIHRVIVGLNSDISVSALKGPTRPLNCQEDRERVLRGFPYVGDVIIFSEPTVTRLLQEVKPTIWMKGGDYTVDTLNPEEVAAARSIGCQIHFAPKIRTNSTTDVLERYAHAVRLPLARDLYKTRHAIARLLITYRPHLGGTWYEDTAKDAGLELDGIGHIKNCRDDLDCPPFNARGLQEVEELAKLKK